MNKKYLISTYIKKRQIEKYNKRNRNQPFPSNQRTSKNLKEHQTPRLFQAKYNAAAKTLSPDAIIVTRHFRNPRASFPRRANTHIPSSSPPSYGTRQELRRFTLSPGRESEPLFQPRSLSYHPPAQPLSLSLRGWAPSIVENENSHARESFLPSSRVGFDNGDVEPLSVHLKEIFVQSRVELLLYSTASERV